MKFQNEWPAYAANDQLNDYIKDLFQNLPIFASLQDDTAALKVYAGIQKFKNYRDVLIFGIGGSSLGGQALSALKNTNKPDLHFIDNIDPTAFLYKINTLDLKNTGIICISKSGNTAEPLMQLLLTVQQYEAQNIEWQKQCAVLTEPKDNALRLFAQKHSLLTFDHPSNIGGRYNVFTSVGAIIAGLCDFGFSKFRQGARDLIQQADLTELLQGAMHTAHIHKEQNINQSVMMVYSNYLELFSEWFCQLWGESLGKQHKGKRRGLTPVRALGAVDQHSQLQLYLDGPRDKFITFITVDNHTTTDSVMPVNIDHKAFQTLEGKTMGDLFKAEEKGTFDTLKANGCLLRNISLSKLNEYELGQLMAFYMIETIATAYLLEIDSFDQPAVEESKIRAMEYLTKGK